MYIACIKRKEIAIALYFVIYESTNVHKLEVVDLNLFDTTFEICYVFSFDACDVHN